LTEPLELVLERAAQLVSPTPQEESQVLALADRLLSQVRGQAEPLGAEVMLGGSVAKGTWLRGEADIDIFVRFPPDLSRERLEELGLEVATRALEPHPIRLRYAEHPYVESTVDGVRVNVVPCYNVKPGQWKSIADRSPYHTEFIRERLTDEGRREVRLLKAFLKTHGLYGAEIEVEGFSGLVCEILILHYGSFLQTLRSISEWRWGQTIALQGGVEGPPTRPVKIRILDPVDDRRDLGAAISRRQIARFIMAARAFLRNPSVAHFEAGRPEPLTVLRNSPLIPHLAVAVIKHEAKSEDVLWGELKRTLRHLGNQLRQEGFQVYRMGVSSDRGEASALLFLLENTLLPMWRVKRGPEATMREACNRFLAENLGRALTIWVDEDGRLEALHPRRHRSAEAVLRELLARGLGVAPGLQRAIRSFEIFVGPQVFEAVHRFPWVAHDAARLCAGEQSL